MNGWLDAFVRTYVAETRVIYGPTLRRLHEPLDVWLGGLPIQWALVAALGLFTLAGIWVWTLRKSFVMIGAPDQRPWRDLRIWATLVLVPYMVIYFLLGR